MKTLVRVLGAVGVLSLVAYATAGEGLKLRYLPKSGELIYRTSTRIAQTQNVMNMEFKNDINNTTVGVWTVGEADKEGNIDVKTSAKHLVAKIKIGPLGEFNFDSKKNDNETGSQLGQALTPLYERLSQGNVSFTFSPLGKIQKLEGYKELIGDLVKDNPLAAQFAGGGSDEVAKMNMGELIAIFSEKPVNPGDRWETPFELNMDKFGKAQGKKTYIYEGEGKVGSTKTAKINVTTELNFDLDLDMGGAKVSGRMSVADSKGTLHFDAKRGCIVSYKNEYKVNGNLNVSVGGKDIPVAVEQTQEIGVELLDKLP